MQFSFDSLDLTTKCSFADKNGKRVCMEKIGLNDSRLCDLHFSIKNIERDAIERDAMELKEKITSAKKDEKDSKRKEKEEEKEEKRREREEKRREREEREEKEKEEKRREREERRRQEEEEKEEKRREKEKKRREEEEKRKYMLEEKKKFETDSNSQYLAYKKDFENEYVMVCGKFYKIMSDGTIVNFNNIAMNNVTGNMIVKTMTESGDIKSQKFLPMWIADEERQDYDSIKFYPPQYTGETVEGKNYNLWNGFNIVKKVEEKIKEEYYEIINKDEKYNNKEQQQELFDEINKKYTFSKEKINELIDPILKHIDFITGNNRDFVLKWMARIIQFPGQKTEVALLIRDMGSLFVDSGGIGKNLLIEFFGKKILGSRYYHVVSENRELYESFNTSYNGKLLIFVEEAGGKENFEHKNDIKSKITKKDISIQGKGDNRFTSADFCNYIFTTNNEKPLPIDKRRFAVFDSLTDKRGDVEYFENLVNTLENFEVGLAFYQYLKNMKTWDSVVKIQTSIPETTARKELIRNSTPQFMKWLSNSCTLHFLREKRSATETYNNYLNWYRNEREGPESNIMKKLDFFNKIKKEEKAFDKVKNSSIFYEAKLDYIIPNLKAQFLLPSDFTMETAKEESEHIQNLILI